MKERSIFLWELLIKKFVIAVGILRISKFYLVEEEDGGESWGYLRNIICKGFLVGRSM